MNRVEPNHVALSGPRWMAGPLILVGLLMLVPITWADDGSEHKQHTAQMGDEAALLEQITELRANVARLQAALEQNHQAVKETSTMTMPSGMNKNSGKMGLKRDMQGMGGKSSMVRMPSDQGMMGGMNPMKPMGPMGGKQGPGMMGVDGMKMMGMRGNRGTSPAAMLKSAMPGFPGASHLYHIGATGLFLDHGQHITLTRAQQTTLSQIQERVMLGKATADRKVAQAQQELWVLTGKDQPDAAKIEAKVRQIEKLKGDKRLAFIRVVGKAAMVLTDAQRKTLVGQLPPETMMPAMTPADSGPSSSHQHTP